MNLVPTPLLHAAITKLLTLVSWKPLQISPSQDASPAYSILVLRSLLKVHLFPFLWAS